MTLLVRQSTTPDQPGILRRRVIGTPAEIDVTLSLLRHSGTLVSASVPRQVGPQDPRVCLIVRVREEAPALHPAPRRGGRRPRWWVKPFVIGGGGLVVLIGLLVGGYLAATQMVTASTGSGLAGGVFLGAAVGLLFLVRAGRRRGTCMGLHCSGCGHR